MVAFCAACGPAGASETLNASLLDAISRAGAGGTVDLALIDGPDWDTMYVFPPYVSGSEVSNSIGWSPGEFALNDESKYLLALTRDGAIVDWVILNQDSSQPNYVTFGERVVALPRSDAEFLVRPLAGAGPDAWELIHDSGARMCQERRTTAGPVNRTDRTELGGGAGLPVLSWTVDR